MRLNTQQGQFAAALLRRRTPPATAGLQPSDTLELRFNIHRNTVFGGLVGAIRARYPRVAALTGQEFFDGLAAAYVSVEPPLTPVMLEYGAGFPNFVANYKAAKDIPYLAGVAAFEWALHDALHSADATPIGLEALQNIDPERLPELRLMLHPSARLVASPYPIASIADAASNSNGAEIELSGAECCLITRPDMECRIAILNPQEYAFIEALANGGTLGQAADAAATASNTDLDLPRMLAKVFATGAVAGFASN